MLNAIKQAAIDAVLSLNPVNVLFGEIISVSPLEVNVDQRFTLSVDFLIITERMSTVEWEKGDKVLLVRVQGGHQYVIWDRVKQL